MQDHVKSSTPMNYGLTRGELKRLYKRHLAKCLNTLRRHNACSEVVEADVKREFGYLHDDLAHLISTPMGDRYEQRNAERSMEDRLQDTM